MELLDLIKDCDTLIFDFDGTLIDSEPYHMKAHSQTLSYILNKNINLTVEQFSKYLGKRDLQIFDEYKQDYNVEFDKEKMITKKVETARDLLFDKNVKIFDYFNLLIKNKGDKKFYIVSNQDDRILMPVLENKGILKYFENVFCLPDLKVEKNDFYNNLKYYIKDYKKVAIFEDSKSMLEKAKELSFKTVGIETSTNRGKLNGVCDIILKY